MNATIPSARTKEQVMAWANRQKTVRLSVSQAAAMDSTYPEWRTSGEDRWERKFEELKSFVATNGRLPAGSSKDQAARLLRKWLTYQNALPEEHPRSIRLRAAISDVGSSADVIWRARLTAVIDFVAANGCLPRRGDEDGRKLAQWLSVQRGSSLTGTRRERLDASVPGWDETGDDKWDAALAFLVDFHHRYGKHPTESNSDQDEVYHAQWLKKHRHIKDKLSSYRIGQLDLLLPSWRETDESRWLDGLASVKAFEARTGRLPSTSAHDENDAAAARWLARQRRGEGMTPEREHLLDAELPRWREPRKKGPARR